MNGDNIYLDTSALLPYYREEKLSPQVENLLREIQPPVPVNSFLDTFGYKLRRLGQ